MLSYAHRAVPRQCAGAQAQAAVLRDERADEGSAWGAGRCCCRAAAARAFRSVALAFPLRSSQSNAQLDGAHEYLKKIGATELDAAALEASAGVGVVVGDCMGHKHAWPPQHRTAAALESAGSHSVQLRAQTGQGC